MSEISPKIEEFDFWITKAVKDQETGEMRWAMVSSDTDEDLFRDEMSLELFRGFVERIDDNVVAPEEYQSEFWKGGMPYLSLSHYSDGNGKNVPGEVSSVYIDGAKLKSKGTFHNTDLGQACFESVFDSVQKIKSGLEDFDPVRVSIGFLDFKHQHKSDGSIFERKSLDDVCQQCLQEKKLSTGKGLKFLDGQLVHEALTRVPVNPRTSMEVERSMTTKKEDAASIVGEELAEEIEENETSVNKALVVKSEEDETSKAQEPIEKSQTFSLAEVLEKIDGNVSAGDVFRALGDVVWEISQTEGVTKAAFTSTVDEARDLMLRSLFVMETKNQVASKEKEVSPVDAAYAKFKGRMGEVDKSTPAGLEELEKEWQEFAEAIQAEIGQPEAEPSDASSVAVDTVDIAKMIQTEIQKAIQPLVEEIAVKRAENQKPTVQRSITAPRLVVNDPVTHGNLGEQEQPKPKISSISKMINRSVGLEEDHLRQGALIKPTGKA